MLMKIPNNFFCNMSEWHPASLNRLGVMSPCSFQVAQGTYGWNLQKHQKQGYGLAISRIIARVYLVPSQRAVETPKLPRSVLCILRWRRCWTGALPFFLWKDLQRCHVVDSPGWQLGAKGEYPPWNADLSMGWGYPGFIGEYGEPRRGKEFEYKFRTMWPWVILRMSAIVWPHRFRDSKWFDLAKLLRRLRSYSNTRLNLILSTCLNILPWDLSVQLRPTQKLDPETCKLALTQAISFVWLCSPSHSKSAICHAPFYICPWLSFLDHSLVAPDLFVPRCAGVFCCAAPCKVWI